MKIIDLHVHSTCSDGTYTPTELIDYAIEKGLSAIALTDHDTLDGYNEFMEYGKTKGIETVPGIEFSADNYGREIHILGLYLNSDCEELNTSLEKLRQDRATRNDRMLAKLNELGFDITKEDLMEGLAPDTVITRAHFARALINKGYVKTKDEAFDKYIGDGGPAYIPKAELKSKECIELIHKAGGISVLAHPFLYKYDMQGVTNLIRGLAKDGLDGVETYYSTHTKEQVQHLKTVANNLGLFLTGGSDFHGDNKPGLDLAVGYGELCIPYELLPVVKAHVKTV